MTWQDVQRRDVCNISRLSLPSPSPLWAGPGWGATGWCKIVLWEWLACAGGFLLCMAAFLSVIRAFGGCLGTRRR